MPLLPSGQVVGITSERARYHTTRLKLQISRETPYTHLYALVDIIYGNGTDGANQPGKQYRFSGATLADVDEIKKWPLQDQQAFCRWLKQDSQVNEIKAARSKLLYDNLPEKILSFPYPTKLYSHLHRILDALPLQAASPIQWKQTVLNLCNKGVRKEEITWSGLLTFLEHAIEAGVPVLHKQQVLSALNLDYIKPALTNELIWNTGSGLPFEETVVRLSHYELIRAGINVSESDLVVLRFVCPKLNYRVGFIKKAADGKPELRKTRWFVLDSYGNALSSEADTLFNNAEHAKHTALQQAQKCFGLKGRLGHQDKYRYVSLPGGEDYREWLVTLPEYQPSYFSSHFTERNMLIHIRTKTRIDNEGRRLLFIEEIQSDWHQAGLKKGPRNRWDKKAPSAPYGKEWVGLGLKLMLIHAVTEDFDGIAWTRGQTQEQRYHLKAPEVTRIYDREISVQLNKIGKNLGCRLETTHINTRESGLRIARVKSHYQVISANGHFITKPQLNREQAMAILARHSKIKKLEVPVFYLSSEARNRVSDRGLPLFGTTL
jgi:hypothetical protein